MIFIKICGIICEYNPLHKGHAYLLEKARAESGADYIICIMSGSFVQRGEAAIMDKFSRTRAALSCGADLILELPVFYALQAAPFFALGGVATLDAVSICTHLAFGSESGDISSLLEASELTENSQRLQEALKSGLSHPAALTKALGSEHPHHSLITTPNNLLGIEYLRALKKLNSPMLPVTVRRQGASHDSKSVEEGCWSASRIRAAMKQGNFPEVLQQLPQPMAKEIECAISENKLILSDDVFFKLVLYRLRTMPVQELSCIAGVSEGLEYKIKKAAETAETLEELILSIKSKRYTYARIQRILCCTLLGITQTLCEAVNHTVPYARVLGLRKEATGLLSLMNEKSTVPVITAPAKFMEKADAYRKNCFEVDKLSTDIYALLGQDAMPSADDFTQKLIVI